MLEILTHAIFTYLPVNYVVILSSFVSLFVLRSYFAGYKYRHADRNLNGKMFILVGSFSGEGLALFHALAIRGAQIIALHPDPSSHQVQQLIYLMRATTENERLYADECDFTSIASIRSFTDRWGKEAKSGMVGDLETRIEAIVFCDGEGSGIEGVGIGLNEGKEGERVHTALALSRHALIQLLLPTLLKSGSTSPVRIISSVLPFYSTGSLSLADLNYSTRPYPSLEPWRAEGSATLISIALMKELQQRVDEGGQNRLVTLNICGGFCRAYFRRLLRASPSHPRFSWIGFVVYLFLLPAIFILTKSAEETAQGLMAAVLGSTRSGADKIIIGEESEEGITKEVQKGTTTSLGEKKYDEDGEEIKEVLVLRAGAVYREGREIRIPTIEDEKVRSQLWSIESKTVERLVEEAIAAEKIQKEVDEKIAKRGEADLGKKKEA